MREYCTESSRWRPEQLMHMRIPRLTLSHSGSEAPQSQHLSLPGNERILAMIRWVKEMLSQLFTTPCIASYSTQHWLCVCVTCKVVEYV